MFEKLEHSTEATQCKKLIKDERERYGRNVVAQKRCKKVTRDQSGYCHIHRHHNGGRSA